MTNDTKKETAHKGYKDHKNISNILKEAFYCTKDLFEQSANKATQFINFY